MATYVDAKNTNANAAMNAFLNPVGPSDAATAALRAQRQAQWNAFVRNNSNVKTRM